MDGTLTRMKATASIILFLAVLLIHLAGIFFSQNSIQQFSKPVLVPILVAYFIDAANKFDSPLKKWLVLALLFSWIGDVLLMFQEKNSIYFLLGLSAFLIAHIFYIILFNRIRVDNKIKIKYWALLIVIVYYAMMMTILYPHLAEMRLPVLVYGLVISFMLFQSIHMSFIPQKNAGRWMITGAVLFVISDSILAFNKFYQPFASAGLLVMLTYGMAQLFITAGAVKYIRSVNSG